MMFSLMIENIERIVLLNTASKNSDPFKSQSVYNHDVQLDDRNTERIVLLNTASKNSDLLKSYFQLRLAPLILIDLNPQCNIL